MTSKYENDEDEPQNQKRQRTDAEDGNYQNVIDILVMKQDVFYEA